MNREIIAGGPTWNSQLLDLPVGVPITPLSDDMQRYHSVSASKRVSKPQTGSIDYTHDKLPPFSRSSSTPAHHPVIAPFGSGAICEVFGIARSERGGPAFDFTIATAVPGPVRTSLGNDMIIDADLSVATDAHLTADRAHHHARIDERFLQAIHDAEARGAWVLIVCSGPFTLAQAGILDGSRATTHWVHTDRLAAMYPRVSVDPDVLFVEDRKVVTSAGTAAGIDAALHIVRREHGAAATDVIARRIVVPPQRDGGQSQYVETPIVDPASDYFALVAERMLENTVDDLTVDQLAHRALMSSRTFARRLRAPRWGRRRRLGSTASA